MAPPSPLGPLTPKTLDEALVVLEKFHAVIVDQDGAIKVLQERVAELEKALKDSGGKGPPSWAKPNVKKRRKRKKGPPKGHKGHSRKSFDHVEESHVHDGEYCPDCGSLLGPTVEVQDKQDIEVQLRLAIQRLHQFHRHYCPGCQRLVRPSTSAVVPRSDYGPNVHGLLAYFKYGLGMTLGKVSDLMRRVYGVDISTGTISEILMRLGFKAQSLYERMCESLRDASVLHADETGWRVDGQSHWLWCFGNDDVVVYHIDPSRGAKVVEEMLGKRFDGVLCTDFYR